MVVDFSQISHGERIFTIFKWKGVYYLDSIAVQIMGSHFWFMEEMKNRKGVMAELSRGKKHINCSLFRSKTHSYLSSFIKRKPTHDNFSSFIPMNLSRLAERISRAEESQLPPR